jgi:hypothetical protein
MLQVPNDGISDRRTEFQGRCSTCDPEGLAANLARSPVSRNSGEEPPHRDGRTEAGFFFSTPRET